MSHLDRPTWRNAVVAMALAVVPVTTAGVAPAASAAQAPPGPTEQRVSTAERLGDKAFDFSAGDKDCHYTPKNPAIGYPGLVCTGNGETVVLLFTPSGTAISLNGKKLNQPPGVH